MKKFRVVFIGVLLLITIVVLIGFIPLLSIISREVAKMYPTIAYMRIPILVLAVLVVLTTISALIFGFLSLLEYGRGRVFNFKTVKYLQGLSLSFLAGMFFQLLIIIYTEINIGGSITNIYVGFGVLVFLLGNQIFKLLSEVIREGTEIKTDNELTI
ncbi:DUF2975 domain-containing protein [Anaerosphaera multitolerans]|uniref:DUF2975 domain-containing protein n=1 Tax=Anaerosphaera multitolerans TaxID=2487351 RepID=A0A437S822_9FIRM|nr:DUF2975 domain-containing protein [Anaerosphaera multitolerans]RVU55152.1 DUF2975 domain-containing protein [Anaerosphaera multitolerans]